jgi:hypothetical protein
MSFVTVILPRECVFGLFLGRIRVKRGRNSTDGDSCERSNRSPLSQASGSSNRDSAVLFEIATLE